MMRGATCQLAHGTGVLQESGIFMRSRIMTADNF